MRWGGGRRVQEGGWKGGVESGGAPRPCRLECTRVGGRRRGARTWMSARRARRDRHRARQAVKSTAGKRIDFPKKQVWTVNFGQLCFPKLLFAQSYCMCARKSSDNEKIIETLRIFPHSRRTEFATPLTVHCFVSCCLCMAGREVPTVRHRQVQGKLRSEPAAAVDQQRPCCALAPRLSVGWWCLFPRPALAPTTRLCWYIPRGWWWFPCPFLTIGDPRPYSLLPCPLPLPLLTPCSPSTPPPPGTSRL